MPRTASSTPTKGWQSYIESRIKARLDKRERVLIGAVGDVLLEERQAREKVEADLRREIEALQSELTGVKARG